MKSPTLSSADRFKLIADPLKPAFGDLERFLEEQVGTFEPEVQPLVRYCFSHSGKRLRPILVFSMARESESAPVSQSIITAAAIVELVHLATLVHDDILDGADMRHRTETVVARYGSHVGVLLGDALFAHALHLASGYPGVQVCRTISLATRQVCSGEIAQTFYRGKGVPEQAAYYRMIDLKTAELFAASAYLGGYLSGFPDDALAAASAYARHLGIAYQIYDDAADIFGRESLAGKTLGTDVATGKFTLPVILLLETLSEPERNSVQAELSGGSFTHDQLSALLDANDILEKVAGAFHDQIQSARKQLLNIPGSHRQGVLESLADFVETAWNKFSIQ